MPHLPDQAIPAEGTTAPPSEHPLAGASPTRSTQFDSPQSSLDQLLSGVAISSPPATGWIRITGPDRVRWLSGMVTNSVQDLHSGAGCYNFFLNAQGRIQGDANIFAEPDHLLLQTSANQVPNLLKLLDRFIIMDDVELADISSERQGVLLAGPEAPSVLRSLNLITPGVPPPPSLSPGSPAAPLSLTRLPWKSSTITLVHAWSPLVPRLELWVDNLSVVDLSTDLLAHGAIPCTPEDIDLLRICEGTPLFGVDIRDRDLPQETGANRALHFSKGCYLGQEIVERIRSRGNVHRTFGGFRLEGPVPAIGSPLLAAGKPVGDVSSVATLQTPAGPTQIGLGYIRREILALGSPILYEGGTATPILLPFNPTSDPQAATHI